MCIRDSVVPGANLAGVDETLVTRAFRTEGVKDRHDHLDVLRITATHQPIAVLLAPHPAADATVDEPDPFVLELLRVHDVVGELAVATIHDQVARREKVPQSSDGLGDLLSPGDLVV